MTLARSDRLFNSSDLVHVFGAGEYEDEIAHNSTYDDGDWNQDGEFNSSDLVLVFREGHYESKVGLVAKQTPAAVDWLFAHDDIDEERERVRRAFVA